MKALPISVCFISGAEVQRLGRALQSVAGWTSEIIVVLNEEVQDGTEELVRSSGGRVYRHPWQGFLKQKNLSLSYAHQPWVLSLDADEVVSPELKASIHDFFAGRHQQVQGARFPRKSWFLGRWICHGDWYPDRVLRLFRADQGRWGGTEEHCSVKVDGPVDTLQGDLLHYSNPSLKSYVEKINYYADLYLQRQLAEGVRWSPWRAVIRSGWRFFRAYIFRLGFLDGFPGFFIAAGTAFATLVRHSRLYEHQQRKVSP